MNQSNQRMKTRILWIAGAICILLVCFGFMEAHSKRTPEAQLERLLQNECHFVYQSSETHECFVTSDGKTKRYMEVTQTYKCSDCGEEIHPTEMHEIPMRSRSGRP